MLSAVEFAFKWERERERESPVAGPELQLARRKCSCDYKRTGHLLQNENSALSVAQQFYVPLPLPRVTRDARFDWGEKCLGIGRLGVLLSLLYPSSESRLQKNINMADIRKVQTAYISLLCISRTIPFCALNLSASILSGSDESIAILGRVVFGFETRY